MDVPYSQSPIMPRRVSMPAAPSVPAKPGRHSLSFWVSQPYLDWLRRLETFERNSLSDVMDRALAAYARSVQFAEEPPPRL